MSLAEELQADFEEGGEEEIQAAEGDDLVADVDDIEDVMAMETETVSSDSVRNVAKLRDSAQASPQISAVVFVVSRFSHLFAQKLFTLYSSSAEVVR